MLNHILVNLKAAQLVRRDMLCIMASVAMPSSSQKQVFTCNDNRRFNYRRPRATSTPSSSDYGTELDALVLFHLLILG